MQYYLAVDIGASSGRHILGWMEQGKMQTEEIYRFENGMKEIDGTLCWDIVSLRKEIINGMKKCSEAGKIPCSMGIDTWGVDYVLLDENGDVIEPVYGYRDKRTEHIKQKVVEKIKEEDLYKRTGIQYQPFNTIYQLVAQKEQNQEVLEKAKHLLMMPDYLNYYLTGVMKTEYTDASTTQLINADTKDWDTEIIETLGLKRELFGEVTMPGTVVGELKEEIKNEVGFDLKVLQCTSHDTASAVLAVPTDKKDFIYISSGTWSLFGTELKQADCSEASRESNFTNEGGYAYRFRYLRNIMGLWMIQSLRKELHNQYDFATLCEYAKEAKITSIVDCNDNRFFAPKSMITEIKEYCRENNQQVPETVGELAAVIYQSLAQCYKVAAEKLESVQKKQYEAIHVIGGGSNAAYLNQLTANATKKRVYAGPSEATAIGNLMVQMLYSNEMSSVEEFRRCIANSFHIKEYIAEQ
ncbi:MAG: rhamnulokinase [bacterium]|nr:rhamnulokinase [bacterium]